MIDVFLVDDEIWLLKEMANLIDWGKYGYRLVGMEVDPFEAKKQILKLQPYLVISDIKMDGLDGIELARQVSEERPGIKFCFLTAFKEFSYALGAIEVGAIAYLNKPIIKDDLISLLQSTKQDLEESFKKRVLVATTGENLSNNAYLSNLFDSSHLFPTHEKARIAAFFGKDMAKCPTDYCSASFVLYSDNLMMISIVFGTNAEKLSSFSIECAIGIGLSPEFSDYSNIGWNIRIARLASKNRFVNGANSLTVYSKNNKVSQLLLTMNSAKTADDLRQAIAALPNRIAEDEIKSYDIQAVYRSAYLNLTRFALAEGDDELYDISAIDFYENLTEMVDDLLSYFPEGSAKEEESDSEKAVRETIIDLENNISVKRSLSYYAKKCGYNVSYFSILFKKIAGKNFAEYFTGLKMERAESLVRTTKLPIYEIAEKVGYDDYYHFSKTFKRVWGLPPFDYREVNGDK